MEGVEIRPDTQVASDIRNAVAKLNLLIIEAIKQKGLTVEFEVGKNLAISGSGVIEISGLKITKAL